MTTRIFRDILRELASFGDLPLPDFQTTHSTSQKRDRSYDSSPSQDGAGSASASSPDAETNRPLRPIPKPRARNTLPTTSSQVPQVVNAAVVDASTATSSQLQPPPPPQPAEWHLPNPSFASASTSSVPQDPQWYYPLPSQPQNSGAFTSTLPADPGASSYTIGGVILPSFFPVLDPNFNNTLSNSGGASWVNHAPQPDLYSSLQMNGGTGQMAGIPGDPMMSIPQGGNVEGMNNGFAEADVQAFLGGDELGMWQAAPGGFECVIFFL